MSSNFQFPPGLKPAAAPGQGGGPQQPGQDEEARAAQMQAKQQEEEMRRGMLGQILEPSARERLSRIAMIRPSQAEAIERQLINLARSGQLTRKLGDDELRSMLEQLSSSQPKPTQQSAVQPNSRTKSLGGGITIQRKRDESDSDEYDL
ncbi:hypothetical protein FFLO_00295 [Filobasidium floriforme]|uniref:PDCD5-related protein n=1 Tax=Filobasidium floriforme TaxID=5210 RepID=A0A8K0JRT4_9TREE|nr:double-stranded DNA-binding domain-containing protein [Filobasidium floriforme]KAG7575476.1 hypothetical protein FFLO_00295 [Filobasidium floriforme]KAH8082613.1 double-stranded DNA-binding domain-containing protein [Filobasidium floriforme]